MININRMAIINNNNNNNFRLIMVNTNRSTLHTLYNVHIQQSATQDSNNNQV